MKYYVIPFTLIAPFMLKVDSFLGAVGLLLANIALHIMQAKSCPNVSGSQRMAVWSPLAGPKS